MSDVSTETPDRFADHLFTPQEVVKQLAQMARDLVALVEELRKADDDAVRKRHTADMKESKAFLSIDGPMDMRRHGAKVTAEQEELEALVAESVVRYLRQKIKSQENRIEVGRSMGVALRSEMTLLPYGDGS